MPSLPSSVFWNDSFHKYLGDVQKMVRISPTNKPWYIIVTCTEFLNTYSVLSIILPIIIAFALLLVPLSTSSNPDHVNEWLFVVFQCVYTIIGYPLMLFVFDFSIPSLTIYIKYILILCLGQVFIIIYFVAYYKFSFCTLALTRAFGPIFYAVVIMFVYAIFCFYKSKFHQQVIIINTNLLSPINNTTPSRHYYLKQYLNSVLLLGAIFIEFMFCEWLTVKWTNRKHDNYWDDAKLYILFDIMQHIFKFVFKRIARYNDANKISFTKEDTISMEICIEQMCDTYYYVFYRNLFLYITSIENFFLIKGIHLFFVLSFYAGRMSKTYFNITQRLQSYVIGDMKEDNVSDVSTTLLSILYDPSPYDIWISRVSLDYSLRMLCGITSGIAYIAGSLFLRYGYNNAFYSVVNLKSGDQFAWTIYYTLLALGIELILCKVSSMVVHHYNNVIMFKPYHVLLELHTKYLFFFVFAMAHVITDVFLAELNI